MIRPNYFFGGPETLTPDAIAERRGRADERAYGGNVSALIDTRESGRTSLNA